MAGTVVQASATAMRRLRHELQQCQKMGNPQLAVRPAEDNLLEWHFVLHSLPADTPYHKGCYHGKIIFPPQYPHAPPAIIMVTPSGRLEVGTRLCLSMTDFHPESWNPAWSVETILVGLLSFFISDTEKGYGAMSESMAKREKHAEESLAFNAASAEFRTLFPEFVDGAPTPASAQEPQEAEVALEQVLHKAEDQIETTPNEVDKDTAEGEANDTEKQTGTLKGEPVKESGSSDAATKSTLPNSTEGHIGDEEQSVITSENRDNAPPVGDGDSEDDQMRCWICHDTTVEEPLIQPCACRGSMSGVHASCVEQWIQHHRRNALNDEAPRCSVCHQPYCGQEQRPGVARFMRYVCRDAAIKAIRTIVLVILLILYLDVAQPGTSLRIRVAVISIFGSVALYKLVVLTVSLPPHRPPPRNPRVRYFFINDYKQLALHIAETFAAIIILFVWFCFGNLSWQYLLPPCIGILIPISRVLCARGPSVDCLRNMACFIAGFLCFPLLLLRALALLVVREPARFVHPLDAGPHIVIAIAAMPLCVIFKHNNIPVAILWISHSAILAAGIFEIFIVKKLQWRMGTAWWFLLQIAALAAYLANTLCLFTTGFGENDEAAAYVLIISACWLMMVCGLVLRINWEICVGYYRAWQNRNGTFVLQVPSENNPSAAINPSPSSQFAPV